MSDPNPPEVDSVPAAAPKAPDVVVAVRDLTKSYAVPGGRLTVLDGLDLDIRRGEFLVIEGKSGIGKTTLLHLLGLLDRPDGGRIVIDGRDYAAAKASDRAAMRAGRISFVFQFFHLLPEFSAIENVMMPGMIVQSGAAFAREKAAHVARAQSLLDQVGIGARAHHRPKELSGGERQRAALARALFSNPDVVLCDEPTGNLDVKTSREIHELLLELNRATGRTFVVVTHDPGLADLATRVVRLVDGKAVEKGSASTGAHEDAVHVGQ